MTTAITDREAIAHWLNCEGQTAAGLSRNERVQALLAEKPGAAGFLWRDQPVEWYHTRIGPQSFRQLRPICGPARLQWRQLSVDGTITGIATRLHAGTAPTAGSGVSYAAIRRYRDRLAAGERLAPLVVRTKRGATPWHVVDGNHRAVALAWHALETGQYSPQTGYVAVTGRSVIAAVADHLRAVVQRVRGRRVAQR